MISNYLQSIEGVAIYPLFSLFVFVIFFIAVTVWVFSVKKEYIKKMSELPLDSSERSDITSIK